MAQSMSTHQIVTMLGKAHAHFHFHHFRQNRLHYSAS